MRSGRNGDRSAVPRGPAPSGGWDGPKAGRRWFRGAVLLLGMLAAFFRPAAPAFSASVYLVAERPDRFLIYNKYQQTITPRERSLLTPFVPMRIIKFNDVLGDGFTPCTTVEIMGDLFYIVKGKDGELSGAERAGAIRRFSDALGLRDTITVMANGSFSIVAPEGNAHQTVSRGERLVRYFRVGDRTFVGTMDQPPLYGFVYLPASARRLSWDIARPEEEGPTAIPERILAAVQENIQEVNGVYRGLYAFFNEQTGEQRPAPHWSVSSSRQAIVCTLINRPPGADLSQSTKYLVKDLQNALLGTALRVSSVPDRIEIRLEQAE